jgi:carbonic anhydrase/acetyltransferase-like protein (isoleucine patch superfamily)
MESNNKSGFEVEFISTSGVYKTTFSLIIIVQLFIGGLILVIVNIWFLNQLYFLLTGKQIYFMELSGAWYEWLLVPLNLYGNMFLFAFTIMFFSAGLFKLLNWIHPPREGVFEKGSKDWKYMHRRFWVAYFPIWLARALPLPWIDIVFYRFFGIRIGKNVVLYEGYIDPVFVEIGDFTMASLHICIFSHLIYQDKIVIKKVRIGKHCIVGPQSIISPGTTMRDGSVLGANSYTWIGQELEGDLIHVGIPASKTFKIQSLEESQEKAERIRNDTIVDNK